MQMQKGPLHPLDVFPYSASNFATLRHIFSSMCGMYKESGRMFMQGKTSCPRRKWSSFGSFKARWIKLEGHKSVGPVIYPPSFLK